MRDINWPVLILSILVFVLFFMPWLGFIPIHADEVRDVTLTRQGEINGLLVATQVARITPRFSVLLLLPVACAALAWASIKRPAWASYGAVGVGATFLLWGLAELAHILYTQTSWGLWSSVLSLMLLFFAGAVSWRKQRAAVKASQKPSAPAAPPPAAPATPPPPAVQSDNK